MFDTIGIDDDPRATRRSAQATLLASLLLGGLTSFVMVAGAWNLAPPPEPTTPLDPMEEEVVQLDLLEVPELPPAPGPRAGGGQQARRGFSDAPPPTPEVAPETIAPLAPVATAAPLTDPDRVRGTRMGTGDADGDTPGPPGPGVVDGSGMGTGLRVVHHTQIETRRRISPTYPTGETGHQACTVTLRIDEKGRPTDVRVAGCTAPFAEATRDAVVRWRWYRPRVGGRVGAVQTRYRVVFRPER